MGYAQTIPYQNIIVNSETLSSETITGTAADYTIGTIYTPEYRILPTYAYLSITIQGVEDTSAARNYLESHGGVTGNFGLDNGTTGFTKAGHIHQFLETPANAYSYSHFVINGHINLNTYLESDTGYIVKFSQVHAHANNLIIYGIVSTLTMYWGFG